MLQKCCAPVGDRKPNEIIQLQQEVQVWHLLSTAAALKANLWNPALSQGSAHQQAGSTRNRIKATLASHSDYRTWQTAPDPQARKEERNTPEGVGLISSRLDSLACQPLRQTAAQILGRTQRNSDPAVRTLSRRLGRTRRRQWHRAG